MNLAKLQALYEMMTEAERAVAEFKEVCQTELTSRSVIRNYINWIEDVNKILNAHAIARAEMVNTGRRISIDNFRHSVVIVRGDWTLEKVRTASNEVLADIIRSSIK